MHIFVILTKVGLTNKDTLNCLGFGVNGLEVSPWSLAITSSGMFCHLLYFLTRSVKYHLKKKAKLFSEAEKCPEYGIE